jgi:lytic murein transglycosylase
MPGSRTLLAPVLAVILTLAAPPPAQSACSNTGSFEAWLAGFKREAAASGISGATIERVLSGITLDESVIRRDRAQGVFAQDFLTFSKRMVDSYRVPSGLAKMREHAATFQRVEQRFGVPAAVITAFWGLETDFGKNSGETPIIRALATLAYDCRRAQMFRTELLAALRIVDSGKLRLDELVGAWAGEIGQMQFLPSHYLNYGVDFDGDGRVDLRRSVPDVLASTAKLLKAHGWRSGQPWLQEVRVPERMPWEQADLAIKHPRAQWAKWGVRLANGGALPQDEIPASLLLPMGRNGPAFLAYPNFDIYLEWNQSLVYATTAAYYATRLAGAPQVGPGRGQVSPLSLQQGKELQRLLMARGYDVGKLDGIIGQKTRAAVKDVQQKLGLPADSYPTPDLLQRLQ